MKVLDFIKALLSPIEEEVIYFGHADIYKDNGYKWRWRLLDKNGEIVAASCQGFLSKDSASIEFNNARNVMFSAKSTPVKYDLQ